MPNTENRKRSNDSPFDSRFGKEGRGGILRKLKPLLTHCSLLIALLLFSSLPAWAAPADPPKTGQTTCWDAAGNERACAGTGEDGAIQAGVAWPNPRYTNTNGSTPISGSVVVDRLTGLMWSTDGSTPTFNQCTGGTKTWQGALDYVACLNTLSYLGFNDWRLPNINELESLVDANTTNTAGWLNAQGFTNVQASNYWSSTTTTSAGNTGFAWFVNMGVGYVFDYGSKSTINYYVWPVRAGQSAPANLPKTGQTTCYDATGTVIACAGTGEDGFFQTGVTWPSPRFTNTDASTPVSGSVVVDQLTGLMWSTDGVTPGPAGCGPHTQKTWQGALDYVACLNTNSYIGYTDWRLPNRKELRSLVTKQFISKTT